MRSGHHLQDPKREIVLCHSLILITAVLVTGCATERTIAGRASSAQPLDMMAAVSPTKVVETRYEVRGYRDAENLSFRHEAHAIFRRTRVPSTVEDELSTVPRSVYPMASYAPLSASDELAAEIFTQKAITAELRVIQASVVETERRMQAHYETLVRQSSEVAKLRDQLEAELKVVGTVTAVPGTTAAADGTQGKPADVQW